MLDVLRYRITLADNRSCGRADCFMVNFGAADSDAKAIQAFLFDPNLYCSAVGMIDMEGISCHR